LVPLYKLGLPLPRTKVEILYGVEVYSGDLLNQRKNTNKFNDMAGTFKGQHIVDKLLLDFKSLIDVTNLFQGQPLVCFELFIEFYMSFKKMVEFNYPVGEEMAWIERF
jgi:hypothetical protein